MSWFCSQAVDLRSTEVPISPSLKVKPPNVYLFIFFRIILLALQKWSRLVTCRSSVSGDAEMLPVA